MASPTPKRSPQDAFARYPPRPPVSGPPDLVDPRFLLKAFGAVVLAAVALAYLSVCLLVYIGGWHRLLHPSATVSVPNDQQTGPDGQRLNLQVVHFDSAATGKPRLTGWWIPSDSATAPTMLYLHDGDGALAYAGSLSMLHAAGVNVFAIDYRGYGQSDGPHPTQARMQEDAAVALDYLLYTRHLPPAKIVPYGVGLGGVLAANLAATHPDLPAVVIDQPRPDAYYQMVDAQQSRLLPMHLLVRDRFDISAALAGVHQPKLLFGREADVATPAGVPSVTQVLRAAPDPKTTVSATAFKPLTADQYVTAVRRFLDESVK